MVVRAEDPWASIPGVLVQAVYSGAVNRSFFVANQEVIEY